MDPYFETKTYWDDVRVNRDKLFPNRKMTAKDIVKNF
jgi:hypothetical protein